DQFSASRCAARLDEEDVAAYRRPCESCGDARHGRTQRHLVLELRRSEELREVLLVDLHGLERTLGDPHRGAPAYRGDLALEGPYARLARVIADHGGERRVGDLDPFGLEAGLLQP